MGRWLTVPFFLLAFLFAILGAGAAAFHVRSQQALLDQEVFQAWQRLGAGLTAAERWLDQPVDTALDPQKLNAAVTDTAKQARLGVIGDRIDSLCRTGVRTGSTSSGYDSLREAVRRDREHLGLAIANYRGKRHSFLGEMLLSGFPER